MDEKSRLPRIECRSTDDAGTFPSGVYRIDQDLLTAACTLPCRDSSENGSS